MKKAFRLLCVEDNQSDAKLILEFMKSSDFQIECSIAKTGDEAISFLYKRNDYTKVDRPDLILLDLNLPLTSGHEVLQQVKSDPHLKAIPVVIFSTSTRREDIQKSYDLGASSYVVKPTDIDKFDEAIQGIKKYWLNLAELV